MFRAASWAFVVLAATAATSRGEFIITFSQSGSNVVATGQGTLDLTALTLAASSNDVGSVSPSNGAARVGSGPDDLYASLTYMPFGTGGEVATSSTGEIAGTRNIAGEIFLVVPEGYVSGTSLSGTATWDDTTISDLGMTPGTYTWSWGTGTPDADSFVIVIPDVTTVPAPGSAVLAGTAIGILGCVAGIRRRFAVAAAA